MNNLAEMPAPAATARFRIAATIKGFPIEVELEGKADSLLNLIERLERIGAVAPAQMPAAGHKAPPVCQIHNKPMKPSRKPGAYYCPNRNADGSYCDEKG